MVAGSICSRAICCTHARPQSNNIRAEPTSTRIAELPRNGSGHSAPVPRKQISIVKVPSKNRILEYWSTVSTTSANTPIPSLHHSITPFLQLLGPAQDRAQRTAIHGHSIIKRHHLVRVGR